jgi:signal peptidase I
MNNDGNKVPVPPVVADPLAFDGQKSIPLQEPQVVKPLPRPAPPASERHAVGRTPPKQAPAEPKNSLREVVETVVFVVVLVLLLKSFVAEAFVIPTGSMAETLWGYQKVVDCPKCGFRFPVNCSEQMEGKQREDVIGCICPNCRYQIEFKDAWDPYPNTGDRVLVAKSLYDTGLKPPQRLDVVVFKFPDKPQEDHIPTNYIKRLVGLPGETIGIFYGKLYYLPAGKLEEKIPGGVRPEDLWRIGHVIQNDPHAEQLLRDGKFNIVRKPPEKILAMRRIVYDNDHPARDIKLARWGGSSWSEEGPHAFQFSGGSDQVNWLHYRHILRDGVEPELITDFMGYNAKAKGNRGEGRVEAPPLPPNWVGDLMMESEVTLERPEGELVFELSKGIDRFQARFDLTAGTCSLVRIDHATENVLETKPVVLKPNGSHQVAFANVDERLVVWLDGALPFGDGVAYDPPRERGPRANDLEPVSIGARGSTVHVRKLKVWRDTYYTNVARPGPADSPAISAILYDSQDPRQELHKLLSDPDQFEKIRRDMPSKTIYVWPGHYLCMGDNSPESFDGRSWGLVPNRLLLGRALLVYYPFDLGVWPLNPPVTRFGPIR